jgi:5-methylcytosine-specific restriction enzyme subunit McrC
VRITVSEQSQIQIRSCADEEVGYISPTQASALVTLGERMGARIASWQGLNALRTHQFVGVVQIGELQLEILPKLDGLPDPAKVRQNLLAMLAMTQDLEVRASEMIGFLESSEPFICALARLYCRRLLEALRRGLRQDYVLIHDHLSNVRGKIDWPAQSKLQATQRLEFSCIYDDRSEDTPLNRTLKAALLVAGTMLEGSRTASVVTELRHAMDCVSDARPSSEQVARIRTDRMNRNLEPLLVLAKLILGNRNPDLGRSAQGNRNTYALVWDMNVLFEEYIGRLTGKMMGPMGFGVDLQEGASAYLAQEATTNKRAFLLKPDILVRQGRKPSAVADTKWKRLDPHQGNLGVSEADVYQVLAYANRYETSWAVLIYPHHPALGSPGLQRKFLIQGSSPQQVEVRVATVDLARLDTIPKQLEQGLLNNH